MKKHFFFLLAICILATLQLSAQWSALNTAVWAQKTGNKVGWDAEKGTQVAVDADGNRFMTIQGDNTAMTLAPYNNTIHLNGDSITGVTKSSVLVKIGADGKKVWFIDMDKTKDFARNSYTFSNIALDADGNIFIAGVVNGGGMDTTLVGNNIPINRYIYPKSISDKKDSIWWAPYDKRRNFSGFVMKYTNAGEFVWGKSYPGLNNNFMDMKIKDDSVYVAWVGHDNLNKACIAKINRNTGEYFFNKTFTVGGNGATPHQLCFVGNRVYVLHRGTTTYNGVTFTGGTVYIAEINPATGAFKPDYTAISTTGINTNIYGGYQPNKSYGLQILPKGQNAIYLTGATNSVAAGATASIAGNTITNESTVSSFITFNTTLTMNANGTFETTGLAINKIEEQLTAFSGNYSVVSNVNSNSDLYTVITSYTGGGLRVKISGDTNTYPSASTSSRSMIFKTATTGTFSYVDKISGGANCPFVRSVVFDPFDNLYALYSTYDNVTFGTISTNLNGKRGWLLAKYSLDNSTAINELNSNQEELKIFPIPAKTDLTISTATAKLVAVSLMNASGQIVYKCNATENTVNLNLNGLAKGVYVVLGQTLNGMLKKTIIIN